MPEPELGVSDTTVGGAPAGETVQVPISTKRLFDVSPPAYIHTLFCPSKLLLKVSATISVALSPEVL
jgi:hypothetical protein